VVPEERVVAVRVLRIIGIGAGDPDYVTVQAIKALNQTEVFFFFDKGEDRDDLIRLRREICQRYIEHDRYRTVEVTAPPRDLAGPVYGDAVAGWHEQRVELYERLLSTELGDGQTGAFLAWGDPGFYDSTLRVLQTVLARGAVEFELDVIPGISAVQALAARHKIALTPIGGSVIVTTARQLTEGWPNGLNDVVVMLDPSCSFRTLDDQDATIYWGAYLGTPDEILISGTIEDCGEEIERARSAARARKGWMFDTYLLRRKP
jgi:precorrin-6A synthase